MLPLLHEADDHLTPAQRRAYVIADNKLALNAGWDKERLAGELHALNGEGFDLALTGFTESELDALMAPSSTAAIASSGA
jgi:ParB-like chromosome segregation protein Spo0J